MNHSSNKQTNSKFSIKLDGPRHLRFRNRVKSQASGSRRSSIIKQLGVKVILAIALVLVPLAASAASSGEIASLINQQRSANGLGGLGWNQQLGNAAQAKANDMVAKGYFSHTSPNGWTYVNFAANAGYSWSALGENLSNGFTNSSTIVNAWMASPGHRANVLGGFSEVGVGVAGSYAVAYFGTPGYVAPAPAPAPVAAPVYTAPAPAPKPVYRAVTPVASAAPAAEVAAAAPVAEPVVETPAPAPKPIVTIMRSDAKLDQLIAPLDQKYLAGGKLDGAAGFGFAIIQGASAAAAGLYRLITRS